MSAAGLDPAEGHHNEPAPPGQAVSPEDAVFPSNFPRMPGGTRVGGRFPCFPLSPMEYCHVTVSNWSVMQYGESPCS